MARPAPSPVYVLRGADTPVTSLSFTDPNGKWLLSGGQNGQIHLWDLLTRRIKTSFDGHSGQSVLFVQASQGAEMLMTQGRDNCFKIWKSCESDYVCDGQLAVDGEGFCSALLLPQGSGSQLVALPARDSAIRLFDAASLTPMQTLSMPSDQHKVGMSMCMCAIPDSSGAAVRLVVGYENGALILWDIRGGKALHHWSAHDDAVMCTVYSSANLNRGFSGSVDEKVCVWTVTGQDQIELVKKVECTNAGFNNMCVRSDNKILATAGWDNQVRIFSGKSMRPLALLAYHRDRVNSVVFSQDHLLAVGSKDQLVSLWDVYRT